MEKIKQCGGNHYITSWRVPFSLVSIVGEFVKVVILIALIWRFGGVFLFYFLIEFYLFIAFFIIIYIAKK